MSTGGQRGPNRRERRRARKLAAERQRAWEEIRLQQEVDGPRTPPTASGARPPMFTPQPITPQVQSPQYHEPQYLEARAGSSNAVHDGAAEDSSGTTSHTAVAAALSVLHPAAIALASVFAVIAGSPLVDGSWHVIWFTGAVASLLGLLVTYPRTWRSGPRRARSAGMGVAVLLAVAAVAGGLAQNVVEGRAQLRGSSIDRAVDEHRELVRAAEILGENQRLLTLPPEQAIPLGAVYAEARMQAIAIGERWNPATRGAPPVAELGDTYVLINLAAAQQAAALQVFVANLENPEPALEAELVERGSAVAVLLAEDVPRSLEQVDRAIRKNVTGEATP